MAYFTTSGIISGTIALWSGAISAIPGGWVICDGNNSTPNLTDKFVIHADNDSGGTNDVGDTGGAHSHTLTTNEMPAHKHTVQFNSIGGAVISPGYAGAKQTPSNPCDPAGLTNTGGGAAHENRPAFYALAYIMKV